MHCHECKYSLHEYLSGKLNELESRAIARHLKSCDRCRRELEEIREMKAFLKLGFQETVKPPADLKSSIMASINPRRYKKSHKNTFGELANLGMSLVAAGLILLLINITPLYNTVWVQENWSTAGESIREKVYQPINSINAGFDEFIERISQLDGITGRREKEKWRK